MRPVGQPSAAATCRAPAGGSRVSRSRVSVAAILRARRRVSRLAAAPAWFLEGLSRSLGLLTRPAGALGDVPQLFGVLLQAAGAAAPVDQFLGFALQSPQIHAFTLAARGFRRLNPAVTARRAREDVGDGSVPQLQSRSRLRCQLLCARPGAGASEHPSGDAPSAARPL